MARAIDERQGIGVYTRNLLNHLLAMDRRNEYVLFYRNPACLGRYARFPQVVERALRAPAKLAWDQVQVPVAARREGVDVIFHTKFTVPFAAAQRSVMTLHGPAWFVRPEMFGRLEIAYVRVALPLYCRHAAALVANSELTRHAFVEHLGVPPDKIHTVHLAQDDGFRRVTDPGLLAEVRRRYGLPERFVLTVTKYHPLKNFGQVIAAFERLRRRLPCALVVVGRGCERYARDHRLAERGLARDVLFTGWVPQGDLPAIYSLGECLFLPSAYEAFGIPACEAMACGTPVVVSRTGALPEVTGDAGVLVDPDDAEAMADALYRVLADDAWRAECSARALARSAAFSWDRCARETLAVIEAVAGPRRGFRPRPRRA